MQTQIVKAVDGNEYSVIKKNRVNWLVQNVKTGERVNWNALALTHVRYEDEVRIAVDNRIRIGALVSIKKDAGIRKNPKFARDADKHFVLIGFGKAHGEFKAIELGGNDRNAYWSIASTDLEVK